ncbi:hypothetical protein TNCV_416831 [Trichonephila clavipes]|nr:hypothetical protein TNCV_416831 [Trichonephila clavipes]
MASAVLADPTCSTGGQIGGKQSMEVFENGDVVDLLYEDEHYHLKIAPRRDHLGKSSEKNHRNVGLLRFPASQLKLS